jgi:hypothetical protein
LGIAVCAISRISSYFKELTLSCWEQRDSYSAFTAFSFLPVNDIHATRVVNEGDVDEAIYKCICQ